MVTMVTMATASVSPIQIDDCPLYVGSGRMVEVVVGTDRTHYRLLHRHILMATCIAGDINDRGEGQWQEGIEGGQIRQNVFQIDNKNCGKGRSYFKSIKNCENFFSHQGPCLH